jgi:phage tail sheath protein FI
VPYTHGVYVQENPTSVVAPITADSAVQVIVGTAPVNLLADPASAVNKPILANTFAEAVAGVGYSDSFDKFTLCQSIDASFRVFNVAPLVLINVLDPEKHTAAVEPTKYDIVSGQVLISEEGILKSGFTVKDENASATYNITDDYTLEFDAAGYMLLKVVEGGQIATDAETKLTINYSKLDSSLVDGEDIIGSYETATGVYTGLQCVAQVYPQLGLVPGLILAPGWSHLPAVGTALTAKCESINGSFNANCLKDVDSSSSGVVEYSGVKTWKDANSYTDKHDIVCWPMCKIGDKKYYMSALLAALIAYTDANNDGVPYVSPSNKSMRISGAILADGTEVFLDQLQANVLNGQGICTTINLNGWKSWGNNTGIYPASSDVKDRFIPVRRMFDWWGNTFILTYFQKVDSPLNKRLIEAVVDSENIRANGYKSRYQIADAHIEYNADENPVTDLLNGKITFHQYLTPYPPAETIDNILEFDSAALTAALE